jgi:hypothetical protein
LRGESAKMKKIIYDENNEIVDELANRNEEIKEKI